jgi:hypothetical protein
MLILLIKAENIERYRDESVSCAGCTNHGDFRKDRQVGWCTKVRRMMSTWHRVICDDYQAR